MPAMSFHSVELLLLSYRARNRAIDDGRRPNALTADSIVAVVMAAASTEAFIHELADHIAVHKQAFSDSLVLSGTSFRRDAAPFQDFATLIRLRNAIVHMKPATRDEAHQGERITEALAQRGIAHQPERDCNESWFHRLEVPEVARWACDVARAIIIATLNLVPVRQPDGIDSLREQFHDHLGFRAPDI